MGLLGFTRARASAAKTLVSILAVLPLAASLSSAAGSGTSPRVWVAAGAVLKGIDTATNQVAQEILLREKPLALGVDPNDHTVWALTRHALRKLSPSGAERLHLDLRSGGIHAAERLAVNPYDGSLWVAGGKDVLHLSGDGEKRLQWRAPAPIQALALDIDESLWLITHKRLLHLAPEGDVLASVDLKRYRKPTHLAVDSLGGTVWIAAKRALYRFDMERLGDAPLVIDTADHPADKTTALAVHPRFGTVWLTTDEGLRIYDRAGNQIRTLDLRPHGLTKVDAVAHDAASASLWIAAKDALARLDNSGNPVGTIDLRKRPAAIGTAPFQLRPTLSLTQPADGSITNNPRPPIMLQLGARCNGAPCVLPESYIDSLLLNVTLDNRQIGPLFARAGTEAFFTPVVGLADGAHALGAEAVDLFEHRSEPVLRRFTVDTVAPRLLSLEPADGTVFSTPGVVIEGRVDDPNASVLLSDDDDTTRLGGASFAFAVTLEDGENRFTLVARDPAGNETEERLTLILSTLPPDPGSVAPPLDPTGATAFSNATEFLYTGPNAIQTGVEPGTIEPRRAAVIRGRVQTRAGTPLGGVTVSVLNRPELGETLSRADGRFDLAVNGGGGVTLNYQKADYLPAQRQVEAPWRDYVFADDVALIPLDPVVTTIEAGAAEPQVAQGSVSTDADGSRQARLLFMPGTTATMVLPDGSTEPLTTLDVRATEYTVGENGPKAMPAALPPTSGYTYAVELSVDQAIAAGAERVVFNRPVIQYVENFLGFPIGEPVPTGHYDRRKAAWIPSDNGRVIEVLSTTAGLADIDADGDASPDSAAQLAALGITDTERAQLAALYPPNTGLWRVPVTHFTPWDHNWPFGPENNEGPGQPEPQADDQEDDACETSGSIIECQNQVLGEEIPVVGTPFSLNYRSNRVPGREAANSLTVSLSGSEVPDKLKRIDLVIEIAGRRFAQSFPPVPNQKYEFSWDGLDAYGRRVNGRRLVSVRVGYVYRLIYFASPSGFAQSFGLPSGRRFALDLNRAGMEATVWQRWRKDLGFWDARGQGLGGWSLSPHHRYDSVGETLILGNGHKRSAQPHDEVITTVVGQDVFGAFNMADCLAADPEGNLFIADPHHGKIWRLSSDGVLTAVVGRDINLGFYECVAIGPDGSLYIADGTTFGNTIERVSPEGIMTTVAGEGGRGGFGGDGGPAVEAFLNNPSSVAVAPDGTFYISDRLNHRIRRVSTNGTITTVAGTGVQGSSGDGGPATEAKLSFPNDIALGPDGSLYIVGGGHVRRVSPDGTITTVAGAARDGSREDGVPATEVSLGNPHGVAVGSDGSLYIAATNDHRVRRVSAEGIITTVAGTGARSFSGDGGPATQATLETPNHITFGPDGSLYISEFAGRVRKVSPTFPQSSSGELFISSKRGQELYVFTADGRHLRTLNTQTGAVVYEFGYSPEGYLTAVTDGDGNVTTIERSGEISTAIVSPDGLRTELTLDGNGYLAGISNPAGEAHTMAYTADGLLTSFTNPRGHSSEFFYDGAGRLARNENAAGGFLALARTQLPDGYEVNERSALNRTRAYRVERLPTGDRRWINTAPDGTQTQTLFKTDGTTTTTAPDGTTTSVVEGPDPRFAMQTPINREITVRTPSGLRHRTTATRSAELADPNDLLSLQTQTDTVSQNGKVTRAVFDAINQRQVLTSPEGRQVATTVDSQGRPTRTEVPGLTPVLNTYDPRGRLSAITQGEGEDTRTATFSYNAQGFLARIVDPAQREQAFTYDAAGRLKTQTLPDGRSIEFNYDANGNVTGITPPGRPRHSFEYTPVDLEAEYAPPTLPEVPEPFTRFAYNLDKQLTTISRPNGQVVALDYDAAGRLRTTTLPGRTITLGYSAETGQLTAIGTNEGVNLDYTYDGFLPLTEAWSGPVAGTVSRSYNSDFRVSGLSVNGANINLAYDNDNLLTRAGDLAISRDGQNGLITATALGATETAQAYNPFGEVSQFTADHAGNPVLDIQYTRDRLGRIVAKTETADGEAHTFTYAYDDAGRLTEVQKDDTLEARYTYDENSNRLSKTTPAGSVTATYDAQDRLLTYGNNTYGYTENGELRTKTNLATGDTTSYTYDALGNLTHGVLPDGTEIDYLIDGRNRRVGKRVNGELVQGFLYQDQLNPVAELDGAGNVIARFVYGTRINVPDHILKDGVTYRIISDHLGSPRLVVNTQTGNIAQRLDYDEFGNITTDTHPGFQPFGFAGGLYDQDTKLVRFGARDYDPETGRWTGKDPIRFGSGDWNLYGYGLNDPINQVDVTGLAPSWVGPTGAVLSVTGGTLVVVAIATGNPVAGALGVGLLAAGGALTIWDWSTTPAEEAERFEESENAKELQENMRKLRELLDGEASESRFDAEHHINGDANTCPL